MAHGAAPSRHAILGKSDATRRVRQLVEQYAATPWTVLINGETGTGKELVARALHDASLRRGGPFVAMNCAAIPESLIENELFGHVRGAFTGADHDRPGVFRAADGGSLFLDEIGELPLGVQAKLLRVLELSTYRPLGAMTPTRADVRLIVATNRDLRRLAEGRQFRSDLYYRLDVLRIYIPPLRERLEDIPVLAEHLVERYAPRRGLRITQEAMAQLLAAPWYGNVRELEHVLLRAALHCGSGSIKASDLLLEWSFPQVEDAQKVSSPEPATLQTTMQALEQQTICQTLRFHNGNKTSAARQLGITYRGLLKKLQRLGCLRVPPQCGLRWEDPVCPAARVGLGTRRGEEGILSSIGVKT